jgi:hypothetical protein
MILAVEEREAAVMMTLEMATRSVARGICMHTSCWPQVTFCFLLLNKNVVGDFPTKSQPQADPGSGLAEAC